MFDVLAPGKLVLTLQSTPPFVIEGVFVLALTVLLAAPLIARVYFLLDVTCKPLRAIATKTAEHPSSRRRRSLVMHYPAPVVVDSTSSSSLLLDSARRINSTPTLRSSDGISGCCSSRRDDCNGRRTEADRETRKRKRATLDRTSTYGNPESPLIDDTSSLDYRTYRHELVEATLRKRYDDFQPPGDVVMNSLHLNSADSTTMTGARVDDRYDRNLFDFVEGYYGKTAEATSRRVSYIERLCPLNHFLIKGARRPRTVERETAVTPDGSIAARDYVDREHGGDYFPGNVNGNFAKLPCADDNGNPTRVRSNTPQSTRYEGNVSIPKSDVNTKLEASGGEAVPISQSHKCADKAKPERCTAKNNRRPLVGDPGGARRSPSWTTTDRPASAGSVSAVSKSVALSKVRDATESSRPKTSAGLTRESKKKSRDYQLPSAERRGRTTRETEERSRLISASSSEVDDEASYRSRESSISPRWCRASRPPWLSGNRDTSFNRKYGSFAKNPVDAARPTSAYESRLSQKLPVASQRGRSTESPTSTGRRAASFIASREREVIRTSLERREGNPRQRQRPDGLKNVESAAVEGNETKESLKKSSGENVSANDTAIPSDLDNAVVVVAVASSSSSSSSSSSGSQIHPTHSPSRAASSSADAPAIATKESRSTGRSDDGTARRRESGPGCVPGRIESPLARNQRLRGAENSAKGAAPPSPKIELSVQVLSPEDDADKTATPNGGKLVAGNNASRIDPRGSAKRTAESVRAVSSAKVTTTTTTTTTTTATANDTRPNNVNCAVRYSKVPRIIQNPRARPTSANNANPDGSKAAATASRRPIWRNANPETRSGLNGGKLNTRRSSDAVDKMRCDESARPPLSVSGESGGGTVATKRDDVAEEELKLPRDDSRIGLAMNSALERYIKILRQSLLNRSAEEEGAALASLSLSDAITILSEQKASLSPDEIRELQTVLKKVERDPELLRIGSFANDADDTA